MNGSQPISLAPLELRVLSGMQAGARLQLAQGEFVLGSGEVCDVLLAGPSICDQALRLQISEDAVSAEPLQPDCVINGHSVSPGRIVGLEPGSAFTLSDVWLAVDNVDAPWPGPGSWLVRESAHKTEAIACSTESLSQRTPSAWSKKRLLASALLLTGNLFCFNNISSARLGLENSALTMPTSQASPTTELAPALVPVMMFTNSSVDALVAQASIPPTREARRALDAEIAGLGLERTVRTFIANDRVWIVGAAAGRNAVDAAVARLKQTYGDVFAFTERDRDRGPAPVSLPFKVRQVTCGTLPSISLNDGQKLYEGAAYKGYVLERVDDGHLVLRGAHRVLLAC